MKPLFFFILVVIIPSLVHGQKIPLAKFHQADIIGYSDVIEFRKGNKFERRSRACLTPIYGKGTYNFSPSDSSLILYYSDYPHLKPTSSVVYSYNDSQFNFIDIIIKMIPDNEGVMFAACNLANSRSFVFSDSNGRANIKVDKGTMNDSLTISYMGNHNKFHVDFRNGNYLKINVEILREQSNYMENTTDTFMVKSVSKKRITFKQGYSYPTNYMRTREYNAMRNKEYKARVKKDKANLTTRRNEIDGI